MKKESVLRWGLASSLLLGTAGLPLEALLVGGMFFATAIAQTDPEPDKESAQNTIEESKGEAESHIEKAEESQEKERRFDSWEDFEAAGGGRGRKAGAFGGRDVYASVSLNGSEYDFKGIDMPPDETGSFKVGQLSYGKRDAS